MERLELHTCNVCGCESIFRCSSCQMAYYCSRVHQIEDWKKQHRQICIINQNLKEINAAQMEMQRSDIDSDKEFAAQSSPILEECLNYTPIDRTNLVSLHDLCDGVIANLATHNFAVIDKFIEEGLLSQVLGEVRQLYYDTAVFQPGQFSHITGLAMEADKKIRGDLVTWIDSSSHPQMKHLLLAVQHTDELIALMSNDRRLLDCNIRSRSSVMVASYPGNGTRYKRHVDNPCGDGRKLTTILYLNKNYVASRDGGALRIYKPDGSGYYDVEPIFGRLIIFWSDYRTPHEVLPCFLERFAISVWYFDTKERSESSRSTGVAIHMS